MQNPMLKQLSQSKIAPMINVMKACKDPQALLAQMPQYKPIMDYINANGGDPKEAFYKMANEMGIDPNDVLSQLR